VPPRCVARRAKLAARIGELADTAISSSGVVRHHGTYFYERTPVGANSPKLFVREGATGTERALVDPDTLSGPRQAISYFVPPRSIISSDSRIGLKKTHR